MYVSVLGCGSWSRSSRGVTVLQRGDHFNADFSHDEAVRLMSQRTVGIRATLGRNILPGHDPSGRLSTSHSGLLFRQRGRTLSIAMVSLSKTSSVEHLLARFRPALGTGNSTTSPAPTAVMIAATENTPHSTEGREVVRYQPASQRETRSQVDRLAKADAGDLQARLELITVEAAEEGLARRLCKH